jgi:hypothetical protein
MMPSRTLPIIHYTFETETETINSNNNKCKKNILYFISSLILALLAFLIFKIVYYFIK